MKQLNSKKTRFPRFDKILVIQPIAEVYGEGNERQLCSEISVFCLIRFTTLRIPEVEESNHHSIWNRLPSSNCRSLLFSEGDKSKVLLKSSREDNSKTNDSMLMKIAHAQLHMYTK